ncbi:MAG: hypothetical protein JXR72_02185 [Proteobacteria bacterium]|nr:hypothetical protein [Pseudomonadota bacterium]
MPNGFIGYQGEKIYLIDVSGITDSREFFRTLDAAAVDIRSCPLNSVRTLVLTSNARFDSQVVEKFKLFAKGNTPYVEKSAIVGLSGIQGVVLNAVRVFTKRKFEVFKDLEEAKKYLVSD